MSTHLRFPFTHFFSYGITFNKISELTCATPQNYMSACRCIMCSTGCHYSLIITLCTYFDDVEQLFPLQQTTTNQALTFMWLSQKYLPWPHEQRGNQKNMLDMLLLKKEPHQENGRFANNAGSCWCFNFLTVFPDPCTDLSSYFSYAFTLSCGQVKP